MKPVASPAAATDESARRRSIAFLNLAHGLDHFVLLIYPTVVIGLEVVYQRPYSELIALSSAAFIAFGIFSLPAGWLADRWSRRNMMAAFYFGCGVSLVGVAFAPNLLMLAVAHVCARHVRLDLSSGRHGDADRGLGQRAAARSPSTASAAISAYRLPPASARCWPPGSAGARPSWCRPRSASPPASSISG